MFPCDNLPTVSQIFTILHMYIDIIGGKTPIESDVRRPKVKVFHCDSFFCRARLRTERYSRHFGVRASGFTLKFFIYVISLQPLHRLTSNFICMFAIIQIFNSCLHSTPSNASAGVIESYLFDYINIIGTSSLFGSLWRCRINIIQTCTIHRKLISYV